VVGMECGWWRWVAGEDSGVAHGGARLVEYRRSSFERTRFTNPNISKNVTRSVARRGAGRDETVEATCWKRGRPELLVWSETA
jgi:hypothetical protein